MKMKNLKILLILLTLSLFSCDDYLDVNTDPNRLNINQVGANKLLPGAQLRLFIQQSTRTNQLGNVMMNSWYANTQQYTGGFSFETQLLVDNVFYSTIFEQNYIGVANLQRIINLNNDSHSNDNYIAAAKILKAYYLQTVVDLYGDVPLDDAFKGLQNPAPIFEDDFTIYKKLILELDQARALITSANPAAVAMGANDIMLSGDMTNWEKFANTLELRMLMRLSKCATPSVVSYRDGRLPVLAASNNFLTQNLTIQPGFSNASDEQQNPFYNYTVADSGGATVQNYSFIAPTAHFYKSMSVTSDYPTANPSTQIVPSSPVVYPNVSDPRMLRLFRRGRRQPYLRAITQGSPAIDMFKPGQFAFIPGRIGLGSLNPYNEISGITTNSGSSLEEEIVGKGQSVKGYVVTLAEIKFLLAEASLFRPTLFPNGASDFDAGVNENMAYLSVSSTDSATYLTAINAKPNFGWIGTDNQKLHAVMYQKWIATMNVNAIESFIDYNKTGFPLTPLSVNASQSRKPRRLVYPQTEYIANSTNTPVVVNSDVFSTTPNTTSPFWQN